MQRNPDRVAWVVLWAAFTVFCILVTGIPLGIRYYLLNSAEEQETQLQRIEGTILVQEAEGSKPVGVVESAMLLPGDEVILDATSRGTLDFFERSHVTLYSNTNIRRLFSYIRPMTSRRDLKTMKLWERGIFLIAIRFI